MGHESCGWEEDAVVDKKEGTMCTHMRTKAGVVTNIIVGYLEVLSVYLIPRVQTTPSRNTERH